MHEDENQTKSYDDDDEVDYIDNDGDEDEEVLLQKLSEIGDSGRNKHKTFEGIPK